MYNGRVRTSYLSGRPPVLQPLRYKSGIPDSACNKLYDPLQFCIKPLVKPPKASSNLFKFSSNLMKFDVKARRIFAKPGQHFVKPRECATFQTCVETPISDVIAGLKSRVSQKFDGPPKGGVRPRDGAPPGQTQRKQRRCSGGGLKRAGGVLVCKK